MSLIRISDHDVRKTAAYIVEQHKRFLLGVSDSGLACDSVQAQTQTAFHQLSGICLVFVNYSDLTQYLGECQRQLWDLTNRYYGYFGEGEG